MGETTQSNVSILSPCRVPWHYGVFPLGNIRGGPQGEGVKPYNQKLLWNLTTISLKEEKYIQEPFANDRPYST